MLSSNPSPEPGIDPLAPLEQLSRWLFAATMHIVIGLVIGMVTARLLRSRHLHWSWAAPALVLSALVYPFARLTSLLGAAAVSALRWGRRWHREELEAGSDLVVIAASRQGPVDSLCVLARRASLRRRERLGADGWFRGGDLILGRDQSSRVVSIPFDRDSGGTHTLIVGATGSGKTVTETWMAVRAIERGMGAIVVDPKGDPGMCGEVRRAAQLAGRAFIEWSPDGCRVYNPYARGSETEIADKVLAGERFTEPHYLRQAQRYLGHAVRTLRKAELEVSLRALVEQLDPMRLEVLARSLPESEAQEAHDYLDSLTTRQQSDL